ncbi:MAG: hypothetical protein WC551_09860 [Patescibacteria group bacterium]
MNKHSGRIEVNQGLKVIAEAAAAYRSAWEAACKHDKIDPDARFVVFSDDNPYAPFIGPALQRYRETKAAYEAGGYVGLKLS